MKILFLSFTCEDIGVAVVTNMICLIYKSLLRKRISTPIRSQEKWLSDLQVENASDIDWKDAYTIAFHCTASTKLRTFHYKFLHRRIATNDFLKKINLKQSDKCSFCQREIESISHLFLRCSATIAFWNDVKQFLIQKGLKSTALTDLHPTGLSKFAPSTAIDLVLLFYLNLLLALVTLWLIALT